MNRLGASAENLVPHKFWCMGNHPIRQTVQKLTYSQIERLLQDMMQMMVRGAMWYGARDAIEEITE